MASKSLRTKLIEFANSNALTAPLWRRYRARRLVARSALKNVFHCCTQKTASQWFRGVFNDPVFTDHTGLTSHPYVALGLDTAEKITTPFPLGTIVTHLYIDYDTYLGIPKTEPYRTFFVMRDPRDVVVSWYFSAKKSHALIPPIPEMRAALEKLDEENGFRYIIDKIDSFGYFRAQRSWIRSRDDSHCRIFLYEDLARDNDAFLKTLLAYLGIEMDEASFARLCERNSFKRLAGGREQGDEDADSHYRKGVAGDWRKYFTPGIQEHLDAVTGDLVSALGYE